MLEDEIPRFNNFKEEHARRTSENKTRISITTKSNKEKIGKYKEELNILNSKAFTTEQLPSKTEGDYFEILSFPWKFIILEDLPNIEGPDIWTRQRYYNFCIPYRFFNIKLLINYIESLGYKMQIQSDYKETYPENWEYLIKNGQNLISPNTPQTLIFESI
jgi:hypothetical protein